MNAKRWWAVPLLIAGALGVATAVYVEMKGGDAVDGRLLVAILLNMAMQPLVWLGIGGVILWMSGSRKPVKAAPVPIEGSPVGSERPSSGSESAESAESADVPPAYPIPSPEPVESSVGAASVGSDASAPSSQVSNEPLEPPNRRFDGIGAVLGIVALLVIAVVAAIAFVGSRDGDEVAQPTPTTSTTPSTPTTTSPPPATTIPSAADVGEPEPPSQHTWDLPEFDGSITLEGSVSEGWDQSSMSWIEGDDGWFHLAINGIPEFAAVDGYCIDDEVCDWILRYLKSGDHHAWTVENGLGTSEVLHHALADDEVLGACWSIDEDGPLVAVVPFDHSGTLTHVDRAWVAPDWQDDGNWVGVSAEAIDIDDVLPLPFAGYELPECSTTDTGSGGPSGTEPNTATTVTTRPDSPPSVQIGCPADFSYEYGTTATVTFGYEYNLGSSSGATFDIDYGDGGTYHSPDAAHAERNLFWHDYEGPGFFTAQVTMTGDNGLRATDSCSFSFSWTG